MGIEEVQYTMITITVKRVFGISHEQAILDVEANRCSTLSQCGQTFRPTSASCNLSSKADCEFPHAIYDLAARTRTHALQGRLVFLQGTSVMSNGIETNSPAAVMAPYRKSILKSFKSG
jgi:hypothetical protein